MEIGLALIGQLFLLHIVAAGVCTAWYARRRSIPALSGTLFVVFAWLIPVVGVLCLVIFLAAASNDREPSIV